MSFRRVVNQVTDYDIQALIDGELEGDQKQHVLAHIENDKAARQRYEELSHQKRLLQEWWVDNNRSPSHPISSKKFQPH